MAHWCDEVSMRLAAIGLAVTLGCADRDTGTPTVPGTGTPGGTTPTGTPAGSTTTPAGSTGTGGGTTTTLDCSGMPLAWRKLTIPSSEDFTTGLDGKLYGVSTGTGALARSAHDGTHEPLVPNVSTWGRGTRFLPGGDLVVAIPDNGTVRRFDPTTWGSEVIANGLAEPNGIAIGENGLVYLTQASGRVVRIDPDTAQVTTLFDTPVSTDGITFAPDYRTLYWNSESGQVIKAEIDAAGNLVTDPVVHATVNTGAGFSLLDGMTSDACGNLYVVEMSGRVHRVFPDGSQQVFVDLTNQGPFISAVNFGSGFGGFEETFLYIMDLNGGVFEIETDIPRNWEPYLGP